MVPRWNRCCINDVATTIISITQSHPLFQHVTVIQAGVYIQHIYSKTKNITFKLKKNREGWFQLGSHLRNNVSHSLTSLTASDGDGWFQGWDPSRGCGRLHRQHQETGSCKWKGSHKIDKHAEAELKYLLPCCLVYLSWIEFRLCMSVRTSWSSSFICKILL